MTCADGNVFTGSYRLVTTLTDHRRHPARTLIGLYHERWDHESAYYAPRHTLLAGRHLRSGDAVGLEQEMWALLALYLALRVVMVEAAESVPGIDPDRCSFAVALQAARDQVVQATGIVPDEPGSLGQIGRRVLDRLLAPRRLRTGTRKVKSPMSRYSERRDDGRPDRSRIVTHPTVTVFEPGPQQPSLPTTSRDDRHTAPDQLSADGTRSRPAAGRPDPPVETRGDRCPLRRRHAAHHVSAVLPMGRHQAHPQAGTVEAFAATVSMPPRVPGSWPPSRAGPPVAPS